MYADVSTKAFIILCARYYSHSLGIIQPSRSPHTITTILSLELLLRSF